MHRRFEGKVAVVTGAAAGMGRQVTADLVAEGARVVAADIAEDRLDALVADLGDSVRPFRCDVSDRAQVDAMIAEADATWGRLDVLVNNAGLLVTGTIEETTDDLIERTLAINVKGVLWAIRAATPIMKRQRYGRIVNVASITGKRGDNTTVTVYGASKGAVITLTRSTARELGPHGITCNAIAPHAVMTEMMAYWDDSKKRAISDRIPVRRLGTVQDMSNLMRFLASDEASFISGECININGGYYMD